MAVQEYRQQRRPPLAPVPTSAPSVANSGPCLSALVQVAGLGAVPALIGFAAVAFAVLVREASFPGSAEAAPHADRLMPAIVDRPWRRLYRLAGSHDRPDA